MKSSPSMGTESNVLLRCCRAALVVVIVSQVGVCGAGPGASPASMPRAASLGIYTQAQLARGMKVYLKECSSCHGESLLGGESSPTLVGPEFMRHWAGQTVGALLEKVRMMPPKEPDKLTTEQYADILAVILNTNDFPAGSQELAGDSDDVNGITIDYARGR